MQRADDLSALAAAVIPDGIVGKIVQAFAPFTEADPLAIAMQFIVGFGNAVGRAPHFYVGETRHGMNEYLAVVGRSARARKGDSWNCAQRILREADPAWGAQILNGLSSGEGLIAALSDGEAKMVVESEFASVLKRAARDGNTLSTVLRDLWDGREELHVVTRKEPLLAHGAHVSLIAHATPEDLQRYLSDVDAANGFGNRFIFTLVDRSQLLPNPGVIDPTTVQALVGEVRELLAFARAVERIQRSQDGSSHWEEWYRYLSRDYLGLYGALVARSEAHVARLSALLALTSRSSLVEPIHISQAGRLWEYSQSCIRHIFGDRVGNKIADAIVEKTMIGETLSLTDLSRRVGKGHVSSDELQQALGILEHAGKLRIAIQPTSGRPITAITRVA